MKKKDLWGYFPRTISTKQAADTGMAAVLLLLLIGLFSHNNLYYKIAIPVLIMNMTFPMFYYPFAIIWLGLSQLLGTIVSKIILSIIYFILVIPVGVFRRLLGKDSLQLSQFKKGKTSVMQTRNHTFVSEDIENPY
ncbi:SxtJ family membrane protein [Gaetbulibacter aquiaggeris]|uniref:SxtJ family membrane protein n=1 Tax=Gaetbulibacter aquiaggeris TaxID=1735373 RepID=A0ABW7MKC8_9FLAO